jgi:peptidoglycan hydrolase CwlO-like protein
MRRAVAIISMVLVFAFAFIVTAQEINSADDKIANLKQQLMEIEWIRTDAQIRLEELDEQLKPETSSGQ